MVGIAADLPEESAKLCAKQGYTFPILSDTEAAAIRAYGITHEGGGEDGRDIARPAEFLVDGSGVIRWVNLAPTLLARLRPETVLQFVDRNSLCQ